MRLEMAFRPWVSHQAGDGWISSAVFWDCEAPTRLSPSMTISLPVVGAMQNDGYFCSCRKIVSPSQNTLCKPSLSFCPGRLVLWEGTSVGKEWGKDHIYFLQEGAWGSVSFQDIWLIAQLKEHWKTFTSFISLEEGTEDKKRVCVHFLPFSPSSIHPLVLQSSSPHCGQGRTAEQGEAATGSPQRTAFPNPITGFIASFQQKIGTVQQMENCLLKCSSQPKTLFSRKLFWLLKF